MKSPLLQLSLLFFVVSEAAKDGYHDTTTEAPPKVDRFGSSVECYRRLDGASVITVMKQGSRLLFGLGCDQLQNFYDSIKGTDPGDNRGLETCRYTEPFSLFNTKDYTKWERPFNPCLRRQTGFGGPGLETECDEYKIAPDWSKQHLKRYSCGATYGNFRREFVRGIRTLDAIEGVVSVLCCTIPHHEGFGCRRQQYKINSTDKQNFNWNVRGHHITSIEKKSKNLWVNFCKVKRRAN